MIVVTVVVTVLLAALLTFAALRKLTHSVDVVESYRQAGVPENKLNYLAAVLLVGATGLLLGLWWAPLGVAAAAGVVGYFLVAIVFHVRSGDTAHVRTPIVLAALAALDLVLRIFT